MADILGGFGGSFGGVQGLAAEVPIDDFYKGVNMREYEVAKKLKKKAEDQAYLNEANKLVSINNPNLHLSYVPEYQKKLKPLVDDLLIRSKNGQVDAPYLMQLKSNISNLQGEFEPASKIANNMRQLKPELMSKSAREAIAMFNSGKDINEINKAIEQYKGTPYDLLDENGNIDLSRQIVTDQDPYGSMGKLNTSSLPFNSYEKVDANGNKRITTFERPAHTKAEKEAFLTQMGIPKEQWANIPSTEEIIEVGLTNPQTRKNIMLTNGEEVLKRKQLELDNQAKELALKNTQGITESDPRFADVLFNAQKIVENDAQKVYDAETNAMKDLGMETIQLKSGYKMDNVAKPRASGGKGGSSKTPKAGYYQMMQQSYNDMQGADDNTWNTKVFKSNKNVLNAYAEANGLPSKGDWSKAKPEQVVVFNIATDDTKRKKTRGVAVAGEFSLQGDPNIYEAKGDYDAAKKAEQWLRENFPSVPIILAKENVTLKKKDGGYLKKREVDEMPRLLKSAIPEVNRLYKVDFSKIPQDKLYKFGGEEPTELMKQLKILNKYYLNLPFGLNGDVSSYDAETETKKSYQTDEQEEFEQ
jgi:hypothetical protein